MRKLPGSFTIGFGPGKIAFREENASHVVIDRAGGQALLALCGNGHSQGVLVEPEPFIEASAILVKNGEIVECLRGLLRCLAEFANSESHRFLQMVFGMHVIALQASKCTQQSQCLEPDPCRHFAREAIEMCLLDRERTFRIGQSGLELLTVAFNFREIVKEVRHIGRI